MPGKFPIPKSLTVKDFGEDEYGYLLTYIEDKVKFIKAKTIGIRETLLPKWVRIYKGTPAEKEKTFPWPGASNLVVQLAATHSDELLSRVMAIYANDPLFVAKLMGDFDSPQGSGEEQREILEHFMSDIALEPEELDLYRVEECWFASTIKYGTGIVKFPWEYVVEKQQIYIGGGTEEGTEAIYETKDFVRRDGPHPENVPLNCFGIDPKVSSLSNADFVYHTLKFDGFQLKRLKQHKDIYVAKAVDAVIASGADRSGPDTFTAQQEDSKEMQTYPGSCSDEWDIEECWFSYWKDKTLFSLIAYYHLKSDTVLGIIYNPYPENMRAFEDAKLAYDDDTYFGYGFCEMLESYQREISTTHNWRIDNRHFATTGIGRVNKNSKLSSLLQIYPGVLIPADEGEIDFFPPNQAAALISTEDEQLELALAKERSGVDPAIGGSGGGTVNSKKGNFSTGGMTVMQWQNNRNNLRMSDMRSAHVRMGRKLTMLYANYGIGKKLRMFGDKAPLLAAALDNYKEGKLGLIIKPATATFNREVEKQNDILLATTLERLYQGDAQIIQGLTTPGMPQELKDYYLEVLKAKNALMKHILRNFQHDDADRLVPVPSFMKEQRNAAINAGAGNAGQTVQQPQQNQGIVPNGNGNVAGAVPTE